MQRRERSTDELRVVVHRILNRGLELHEEEVERIETNHDELVLDRVQGAAVLRGESLVYLLHYHVARVGLHVPTVEGSRPATC